MKTLRSLTLTIEILGIIVIVICSYFLLQNIQTLIIDNEIEDQKSKLAEINYYLDTSLNENMSEFVKIYNDLNNNELNVDLDMFSDMYYVNENMHLTQILVKDEYSLIFEGYDVSTSKLGEFINSLDSANLVMSPMMKSSEQDTLSVYISLEVDNNYLVGRIGLEQIMDYLKVSARGQDAIIIVASGDGYVIDSTEESLPFYVVPEFETGSDFVFEDYFLFKQNNELLGNDLLILIPKSKVLELLDKINELLPIFLIAIMFVMLVKVVSQEYLIVKPLQRLSSTIENWDFETQPTTSYINVLDTKEIKAISNQFIEKSAEIQTYIEELNDANMELGNLNQDLELIVEDRTKELTDTIGKLVQSEKLAALGFIVAGVAHEVNTPVGVCITTNSFIKHELSKLTSNLNSGELKKKDLIDFLSLLDESTQIINSNLIRTAELVQSFKQVAVEQVSDIKHKFSMKENINMVIISLKHEYKNRNVKFNIDCPDELYIGGHPGEFSQMFTNFIMNSVHHGFKLNQDNEILIKCKYDNGTFIIDYSDNGVGIPKENLPRIFDPFFTTNRGSNNNGLGMNIVYNIINRMSGSIICESEEGKGVHFRIEIPTNEEFEIYIESNKE